MTHPKILHFIGAHLGLFYKTRIPDDFNKSCVLLAKNEKLEILTAYNNCWDLWVSPEIPRATWAARCCYDFPQVLVRLPGQDTVWEYTYLDRKTIEKEARELLGQSDEIVEWIQEQHYFDSFYEFKAACAIETERQRQYEIWNIKSAFIFSNDPVPGWCFVKLLKHRGLWEAISSELAEAIHLIININKRGEGVIFDPDEAEFKSICNEEIQSLCKRLENLCRRHSISSCPDIIYPGQRVFLVNIDCNMTLHLQATDEQAAAAKVFEVVDGLMSGSDSPDITYHTDIISVEDTSA